MININTLIWDIENQNHIKKHRISTTEIEEACQNANQAIISFRKRLLIKGETLNQRKLNIVLSPQDKNGKSYPEGIYYPITAYESESDYD